MTVRARPFLTAVHQAEPMLPARTLEPAYSPAASLVRFLTGIRVDLGDEARAQQTIASSLSNMRFKFLREVPLNPGDRIDFVVGDPGAVGIGIEVKLRTGGGKREIFSQIERYALSPKLSAVVLMTNLSMGLPEESNGKPLFYVSLGRAWMA